MIIKPIIPIWLMTLIVIGIMLLTIFDKTFRERIKKQEDGKRTERQKRILKDYIVNIILKVFILTFAFIINLRFMLPDGESISQNSDLNVLFVIDRSISMRALDYNGTQERFEGVKKDCEYIISELDGSKFSVIVFGDKAQRITPFTSDSDMILNEIKAINMENDYYADGTSLNIVKDVLEESLKNEYERKGNKSKIAVFFISDGEITKER